MSHAWAWWLRGRVCARVGVCNTAGGRSWKGGDNVSVELITLVVGILTLAGGQIATVLVLVGRMDRQAEQVNQRFDNVIDGVNQRFDGVNQRFDDMSREFGDLRERMARLEGAMDGFLAGRRDRDVA